MRLRSINTAGLRICDLTFWCEIEAMCDCLYHAPVTMQALARGRRADTLLRDVEPRLRCTKCKRTGHSTLIVRTAPR